MPGNGDGNGVSPRITTADLIWPDSGMDGVGDHGVDVLGSKGSPSPPGEVRSLTAHDDDRAGNALSGAVRLTWNAPADVHADVEVTGYEYRYSPTPIAAIATKPWTDVPASALSGSRGRPSFGCPCAITISGLAINQDHLFEVRPKSDLDATPGPASRVTRRPQLGTAPSAVLHLRVDYEVHDYVTVDGNRVPVDDPHVLATFSWSSPVSPGRTAIGAYVYELYAGNTPPAGNETETISDPRQRTASRRTQTDGRDRPPPRPGQTNGAGTQLAVGTRYTLKLWARNAGTGAAGKGAVETITFTPRTPSASDRSAPLISQVAADGRQVVMTYDKPLSAGVACSSAAACSELFQINVTTAGTNDPDVESARASGRRVALTLSDALEITANERATLTYTPPANGGITSTRGVPARAITARRITAAGGAVDIQPPRPVDGGGVKGRTVVLLFDEDLASSRAPHAHLFDVDEAVAGERIAVLSTTVCGRQVDLNLARPVTYDGVAVTYTAADSGGIEDRSNPANRAESFSGRSYTENDSVTTCGGGGTESALTAPTMDLEIVSASEILVVLDSVLLATKYVIQWRDPAHATDSGFTTPAPAGESTGDCVGLARTICTATPGTAIANLDGETTYEVRARAENDDLQSAWTTAEATTPLSGGTGVGSGLGIPELTVPKAGTSPTTSAVTLTYEHVTGAESYEFEWRKEFEGSYPAANTETTTPTDAGDVTITSELTISGLDQRTEYRVRARAKTATADGEWSSARGFTTDYTDLATPEWKGAVTIGVIDAAISWFDVPNASNYSIRLQSGGSWENIDTDAADTDDHTPTSGSEWQFTGLLPSTDYVAEVTAKGTKSGASVSSSPGTIAFTTAQYTGTPKLYKRSGSGTSLGQEATATSFKLRITTGDVTPPAGTSLAGYDVAVRNQSGGSWSSTKEFSKVGAPPYDSDDVRWEVEFTGLTHTTNYEIRARTQLTGLPIGAWGNVGRASTGTYTPPATTGACTLDAPTGLEATNGTQFGTSASYDVPGTRVSLSWGPAAQSAHSHRVEWDGYKWDNGRDRAAGSGSWQGTGAAHTLNITSGAERVIVGVTRECSGVRGSETTIEVWLNMQPTSNARRPAAANQPPVAVDDAMRGSEDAPLMLAVTANDSDPDGDRLRITEVTTEVGTAKIADGGIVFKPPEDWHGETQLPTR